MSDEPLPLYDHDAERIVLGAAMLSAEALVNTLDVVVPGDFHDPRHGAIYATLLRLYGDNQPTDTTAVNAALTNAGEVKRGHLDAPYLHTVVSSVPSITHVGHYARIVADRAALARIDVAGAAIRQAVRDAAGDPQAAGDRASSVLYEAIARRTTSDLHQIGDLIDPALKSIEDAGQSSGLRGASTGLVDLDKLTGGLRAGQLILIAARPAMGKSVMATDIARAVALRDRQPAIMFSLEMSREELMLRILAAECSVPLHLIVEGRLDGHDWHRLTRRTGEIAEAPLYIDDSPSLSLLDIRAKARRLAAKGALSLIVIDYLQLMRVAKSRDQREREVAEISRGLKLLAKELAVPVVAVAQLNRGPEARMNKKPHLSDLRESGSLEADADVVILLHRADYYDKDSNRRGEVDIDVAKNRGGPSGEITATAQLHFARFDNYNFYSKAAGGAQ